MKSTKKSKCPICCRITYFWHGYVGSTCEKNKCDIHEELWRGAIVKKRRELLKMNRPQFAKIVGLSKHTIKRYEYVECPRSYLEKTEKILKKIK